MSSSNIYGTTGMPFQMDANDFDPFKTYSLPDTWTTDATKASSVTNPYSSLSYTNPGSYQSYNDWSNWQGADKTYRNQYTDNGYSLDTAKSFYTQPSNGDWAAYQDALTQPGVTAANQAYDKAKKQLEEWAGGSGLYGSSIMANQATQSKDEKERMELQNQWNKEAAEQSQEYAKEMFDYTGYENQVKQMKAAGLNPALLNGGAGSAGQAHGATVSPAPKPQLHHSIIGHS